jgi:hypothetical protein
VEPPSQFAEADLVAERELDSPVRRAKGKPHVRIARPVEALDGSRLRPALEAEDTGRTLGEDSFRRWSTPLYIPVLMGNSESRVSR